MISPRNEVAFYIATYGEISVDQDPQVARAHRVFDRVRAAADKNSKRLPKLVVVDSPADPWAIALPDGHIVLSRGSLAICHQRTTAVEAEARLAFVLGHELAHLAHDDFWHHEVHSFLATHARTDRLARLVRRQPQEAKARELSADDKGFIYAALAGFPVDRLLGSERGQPHFFNFWMQQTHTRIQSSHPSAQDRAALLQRRLQDLRDKLGLFEFGVRLSHFDYCDDAVYFLREFQKMFPGREVLNNLGYCYLQLARQEMAPERAYFYWMPLLLDGETRAIVSTRGAGRSLKTLTQAANGKAEGYLTEALEYLKRAIEADPGYGPARLNLAVAALYLGKPHQARAVLAEARTLAPEDLTLQGLEALTLYEQSDAGLDLWSTATAKLEKLVAKPEAPKSLLFNLARLLTVRPRPREARRYWNRLAGAVDQLPTPISDIVCREQSLLPPQTCAPPLPRSTRALPWRWPLPATSFEPLSRQLREERLGRWELIPFDWFKDKLHGAIYRRPDGKAEVLELDHFVQMQVLKGSELGTVRDLNGYCARSLRQRNLARGVVWSCDDWAVWVQHGQVREAWWIAR